MAARSRISAAARIGAVAAIAALAPLCAQSADRNGKEVVDSVCVACHGNGKDGAPRIGDAKAWEARSRRGLSSLSKSAIEGVRKMPPHGGSPGVSDIEIKRAIAYMVNQSGGKWIEPIDRAAAPKERSGKAIYEAQCVKCHGTGVNGAPKLGDKAAWIDRARLGFDSVVRSAIHGHGAMPARGGMADLTDAEMKAAVTYMFQTSVKQSDKAK